MSIDNGCLGISYCSCCGTEHKTSNSLSLRLCQPDNSYLTDYAICWNCSRKLAGVLSNNMRVIAEKQWGANHD